MADCYVDMLHLPGVGVRLGVKEAGRDGGGDTIWRRQPSGSAPPENPARRVLTNVHPPAARRIRLRYPPPFRHPQHLYTNSVGPGEPSKGSLSSTLSHAVTLICVRSLRRGKLPHWVGSCDLNTLLHSLRSFAYARLI
jgi:hypothetical protein